jgi:(3S)-malyl-CoA thioesterase
MPLANLCDFADLRATLLPEEKLDHRARPYRSVLYIPGSRPRALEKARGLPTDAIIFDLEDAVIAEEKESARSVLAETLLAGGYAPRSCIVRINGFETDWAAGDLAAMADVKPETILLPKVSYAADVENFVRRLDANPDFDDTNVWAMIETAQSVLNAGEICKAPRLTGIVVGTNDLAKDLGARVSADRSALMSALQISLLAARAAGLVAIDGVYNAFRDEAGLIAECKQGRDMGFDGKTLIHPSQIGPANTAFAPSSGELDLARRQIAAFEDARAAGQGVAVVDGRIVENLHVASAKGIIARSEAIEALQGS